jgi:hypothetical protein
MAFRLIKDGQIYLLLYSEVCCGLNAHTMELKPSHTLILFPLRIQHFIWSAKRFTLKCALDSGHKSVFIDTDALKVL